jgi:hypothetical protein
MPYPDFKPGLGQSVLPRPTGFVTIYASDLRRSLKRGGAHANARFRLITFRPPFFLLLVMHTRRQAGMPPLAIVLPHPPLPRRRSSLLSAGSCGSPHTPRSCGSPAASSFFFTSSNRKSSDSWNSSIMEGPDDAENEWKPDHVSLLQRVSATR